MRFKVVGLTEFHDRLRMVRDRIAEAALRSGRQVEEVRLLPVTKGVAVERIREAVSLGLSDFGENRVQEAREKAQALTGVRWHGIGRLQTNKASQAARLFVAVQSVDRARLARVLGGSAVRYGRNLEVLVEVNVSGEPEKGGVSPDGLAPLLEEVADTPGLDLRGLMTVGPREDARRAFAELRELRDRYLRDYPGLVELSMGMSGDLEDAVAEGSTIVRIGTALFGPRTDT